MKIRKIQPTVFLKGEKDSLQQLIAIALENPGEPEPAVLAIKTHKGERVIELNRIPGGESQHQVFIPEPVGVETVVFTLQSAGQVRDRVEQKVQPPRHWRVHVVQLSHHDAGYTDLASRVLSQHAQFLDQALDYAEQTDEYPSDAQFRFTIEQAWSLDHYLKHARSERAAKMVERLRQGRFELTALFGNLTSELCGHETLVRALYHSARLKRMYGIPLISAEHNDIPGMSWGLARILIEAGIRIFCPGLPLYYEWGGHGLQSFWDEQVIFQHQAHMPGAFWWQVPGGKKLLVWCNNSGCGGDCRPDLPGLADKLQEWERKGYPYDVVRLPVIGAERDNSPYRIEYAETIKTWNEQWAFPHLVCSTNALFYQDFLPLITTYERTGSAPTNFSDVNGMRQNSNQTNPGLSPSPTANSTHIGGVNGVHPHSLPTWHGELPGQDYPVGATSTARATAINRSNHVNAPNAEKLASFATLVTDFPYPRDLLFDIYEEILWHDEHTWGHHFPVGPAQEAAEHEKALHACKAAAFIQEVIDKALARIADQVSLALPGLHLVVFNPTSTARQAVVRAPLREIDNLGSSIQAVPPAQDPAGSGYWRGVLLTDRWHVNPSTDLLEGRFNLVDCSTNQPVPFQLIPVASGNDPLPYAAQRFGLGEGTQRLGMFETPRGVQRDICFIAHDLPAHGYKTYRLVPNGEMPASLETLKSPSLTIENEYYRVSFDEQHARLSEIYDKQAGRNLLDPECPHGFGTLLVRSPLTKREDTLHNVNCRKILDGPVCSAIEITAQANGHPQFTQRFSLYTGIPQVYDEVHILKDPTPLLDVLMAFPFKVENPNFRYEGSLNILNPITDYLPGAYSDAITVQNWIRVCGDGMNILWSSLDAPVVSLGGAWQGYVSPAHRAHLDQTVRHPPLKIEDLTRGWIYARLFNNNFGTNFSISQSGEALFRFVITSHPGEVGDSQAALFGWQSITPCASILTEGPRAGTLPYSASFIQVENPAVVLLTIKQAEDRHGYILRFWNTSNQGVETDVTMDLIEIAEVSLTNLLEENGRVDWKSQPTIQIKHHHTFHLSIAANDLAMVRITGKK